MVWVRELAAGALLGWLTLEDIKTKKLPMAGLIGFLAGGILLSILLDGRRILIQGLLALWILGCCFLATRISKQGIGSGDLWILAGLPFWKAGNEFLWILMIAFSAGAIYGCLRFGIRDRKQRFAFVPWITGAYLLVTAGSRILGG